jgi:Flp pilus assembly protein TadB
VRGDFSRSGEGQKENNFMLWTILAVLLVLWLIGLVLKIGGALIHLILVVALVIFVINLLTGRRTV